MTTKLGGGGGGGGGGITEKDPDSQILNNTNMKLVHF